MIVFERPVRFEEVDAAGIVFFARYVAYAHEAMEHFFSSLPGGYACLILERRVCFPAVHVEITFTAPTRYGDVLRIETRAERLGNRSAALGYRMLHAATGRLACELEHTVVTTDMGTLRPCDMPSDVRALLGQHLEPRVNPGE